MARKPGLELSHYDERVRAFLEKQGFGDALFVVAVKANDESMVFAAPGTSAKLVAAADAPEPPPTAAAGTAISPMATAAARSCRWVYVGDRWLYICS